MTTNRITLSDGKEYEISPVSETLINMSKAAARKEALERGEPIDPPTYTVIGAGDVAHQEPHDETTLETDEDRKAWAAYQAAISKLTVEMSNRQMKALLTGLKVTVPDKESEWYQTQIWLGVELPENPLDLRYHYIITEVLKNPDDFFTAVEEITKLTYKGAVREEDIKSAMDSFRGDLQRKTTSGFATAKKSVEAHSPVERTKHDEGMGDTSE